MRPEAVLFVISAPNLSKGRLMGLQAASAAAAPMPSLLIRLEGAATSLPEALESLFAAGHRRILVQPLGLSITDSLLAWLPGAIASWRADGHLDAELFVGRALDAGADMVGDAVRWALDQAGNARPVAGIKPSLGKPGWQDPPDFTHHLLVCTGPRCQYRDAASLLHVLKAETQRQGVADQCLTARTGCLYPCNQGPVVALYPRGEWYRLPDAASVERFVGAVLVAGRTLPDLLIHQTQSRHPALEDHHS